MNFYLFPANTTPELPEGMRYRVLSTRYDLLDGNWIMQLEGTCDLVPANDEQIAILGDLEGCIAEWINT